MRLCLRTTWVEVSIDRRAWAAAACQPPDDTSGEREVAHELQRPMTSHNLISPFASMNNKCATCLLCISIPFSAIWLRSSVVSVLFSLISETRFIEPHDINLVFWAGGLNAVLAQQSHQLGLGTALQPSSSRPPLHMTSLNQNTHTGNFLHQLYHMLIVRRPPMSCPGTARGVATLYQPHRRLLCAIDRSKGIHFIIASSQLHRRCLVSQSEAGANNAPARQTAPLAVMGQAKRPRC